MSPYSKKQKITARVALAMKRGATPQTPGTPAYDMMRTMTDSELRHMATDKIITKKKKKAKK